MHEGGSRSIPTIHQRRKDGRAVGSQKLHKRLQAAERASNGQLTVECLVGSSIVFYAVLHEPCWLSIFICANIHSLFIFEFVFCLGCVRAIMTLGPGRRRHGIRRTGSLRILAETGHLNAAGSGAIGILEAPPPNRLCKFQRKAPQVSNMGRDERKHPQLTLADLWSLQKNLDNKRGSLSRMLKSMTSIRRQCKP